MILRILFVGLAGLVVSFFVLQGKTMQRNSEKPIFLRTDSIAEAHRTDIKVSVNSPYKPSDEELAALTADYSNIWAHLNHLYSTNDVEAGKEYYTEAWFRQICTHYTGVQPQRISRTDTKHDWQIRNWSSDGLVCTAIDNALLTYQYPDQTKRSTQVRLAVVLLFQGDHWRIDAMRFLNESLVQ
ncbi:hypothetical protein [Rudanella lutea]|uniref:hypothetical protein n=1 Tax=Rudanella lutea TaxID=451374 RepID=UPI0003684CD4|nr:hypothetical protein [Rudanella lutea]